MTDKVLKEAFDKMVAIEEGNEDYIDGNEFDDEHETVDSSELAGKYADDSARQRRSKDDWDTDTGPGENSNAWNEIDEDSGEDLMDGIEELRGIQDELFEVIERLDSAIRAYVPSKHAYWQSYGLAHLKVIAGSDEYAASDESINSLLSKLKAEAKHADDHYDDEDDEAEIRRAIAARQKRRRKT